MYDDFQREYPRDVWHRLGSVLEITVPDSELREFFHHFGGASYRGGLYRVFHPADTVIWNERVTVAFPEFAERSNCFGYDWLGRVFALDANRLEEGLPGVILIDPGMGEVLQVPANLSAFHNKTLLEDHDAALASDFYGLWREAGGAAPSIDQCVGYKKPLFLGGVDDIENVKLTDLDVYWDLMGQIIDQVRGLPLGARVRMKTE